MFGMGPYHCRARSFHSGLTDSTNANFLFRRQPLSSFARAMADLTPVVES